MSCQQQYSQLPGDHPRADHIAEQFHQEYEALAPLVGYRTRDESAVPWSEVPTANKNLMRATVTRLLERGVIR
jgi:hypothetical protein